MLHFARFTKSFSRAAAAVPLLAALCSVSDGCRKPTPVVAVIARTCGTWLWEAEHTGVTREAPAYGLTVYWNGPMREDDVQRQIEILAGAVERRVRGVIITPIEDLPLRTPLHRTMQAGIPVVVVGTELGLPAGPDLTYVLNDEDRGGQLAARRVGQILHGQGAIAILGINKKLNSTAERDRSFESTLANEFPGIHVSFRSLALPTVAQEQQVAERMLADGVHADVIIALSELSTRGALFALDEFNKTRAIPLIGFDQNLLAPIRTGEIDSVVIQNTYQMGRVAMRLLGEEVAGSRFGNSYTIPPQLVTRENIDSAPVREALDLDWFRQ